MHHMNMMVMFHNRSITKQDGYKRASLFYNFRSKSNVLQLDKSHKTILGKLSSVLNRNFKRTISFKKQNFSVYH
jgi:hypothetical protein